MNKALTVVAEKRKQARSLMQRTLAAGVENLLPDWINPAQMEAAFAGALVREPKLLDCTKDSLVRALVLSASCGLPPDGYHAHLIPFRNFKRGIMEVTFMPDWKGLTQLALRNNVIVEAEAVYENDEFDFQFGTESYIKHKPKLDGDRGKLYAAYAIARFGGTKKFVVLSREDIMKRKAVSRYSDDPESPWNKWEAEMASKSAVKVLAKYFPRTGDVLTNAISADDAMEIGTQTELARAIGSQVSLEDFGALASDEDEPVDGDDGAVTVSSGAADSRDS